jgi:hypothetical protein
MDELNQHRRSLLRWRHCICEYRWPCQHRQLLLEERVRQQARAAVEWYPRYFAQQRHAERRAVGGAPNGGPVLPEGLRDVT